MKTVKKSRNIQRVSNAVAEERVNKGWKYCPKADWKKKVRDKTDTKKKSKKDS